MRVKGGYVARRSRKKFLKLAKGYRGSKHRLFKIAKGQVIKSLAYAYRDRRVRKREFRALWIVRINAAARVHGLTYSRMMAGLKAANIEIDRKMLAETAVNNPEVFKELAEIAKKHAPGVQAAA